MSTEEDWNCLIKVGKKHIKTNHYCLNNNAEHDTLTFYSNKPFTDKYLSPVS